MHPAHTEFRPASRPVWWRPRLRGVRAVRPERIVIRGPLVHLYARADTEIWRRGMVRFRVPRPPGAAAPRGLRRCIVAAVPGGAPRVLDCRAFSDAAFADLVRHLRNFEAIGDAGRDPWAAPDWQSDAPTP